MIAPELQRRSLFRKEHKGRTLRNNLALKQPVSRRVGARNIAAP
jgi:hypothetical protein